MRHRFHIFFKTSDIKVRMFWKRNLNGFTVVCYEFKVFHSINVKFFTVATTKSTQPFLLFHI